MNADNLRKVRANTPQALSRAALEAAGDHPGRPRPEILRNLRPVRAEERPALRRHLGQGLAAVAATSTTTCCRREVRALKREQALPLAINPNSDQYLEERLQLDEQLATVTGLAKDNELPDAILTESGLEITPLDAAVRIEHALIGNQPVTAAHQDHRTADGRGRLDGLQPPLHPLEGRGRGQRQDVAAVRNPR
ncbi:hypothetical protein ACLB1E_33950 [Escherichia coli]